MEPSRLGPGPSATTGDARTPSTRLAERRRRAAPHHQRHGHGGQAGQDGGRHGRLREFVVQPFLDAAVTDPFLVEWKSDQAWRLSQRHQRLRRHHSNPRIRAGRTPWPLEPLAACKDTLFVVSRRAWVINRIARRPSRSYAGRSAAGTLGTSDQRSRLDPPTHCACTVCFRHVFSTGG